MLFYLVFWVGNLPLHGQYTFSTSQTRTEKVFDPYHARQTVVSLGEQYKKPYQSTTLYIAPRVGIEPTTNRLTVDCFTAELPRNLAF